MCDNDRCGIRQQSGLEDLPRMDERRIERPATHFVKRDDAMLRAEAKHREHLCRLVLEDGKTSPHPVGRDSGFEIDWSRENYVVVVGTRSSSGSMTAPGRAIAA